MLYSTNRWFLLFLLCATLTVIWCLSVVLVCISLMVSDTEHSVLVCFGPTPSGALGLHLALMSLLVCLGNHMVCTEWTCFGRVQANVLLLYYSQTFPCTYWPILFWEMSTYFLFSFLICFFFKYLLKYTIWPKFVLCFF